MDRSPDLDPIERIIDRRLPGLTGERRALARERLSALADLLIRIAIRQAREAEAADSRDPDARDIMDSSRPPS